MKLHWLKKNGAVEEENNLYDPREVKICRVCGTKYFQSIADGEYICSNCWERLRLSDEEYAQINKSVDKK